MKILLVNPPNCGRSIPEEQYGIDSLKQILRAEPLSLESLAGNLDGHDVRIVDLKAKPDIYRDVLEDFHPAVVGITGVTCEANTVIKLAAAAKKEAGAIVVVGGVHASNDPSFFNREEIDYIVVGLGKLSFRELVDALESGKTPVSIPGIAKTAPGKALFFSPREYCSDDLVEHKPPRYDLTDVYRDEYVMASYGTCLGMVSVAFGCPFKCSFCSIQHITDGRYLTHSVDTVLRDIETIKDMPIVRLVDANTFGNVDLAFKLARSIQEEGIKRQFLADVRSDTVVRHPDLFVEWKKAGLRSVIIGFEEIDDTRLAAMKKANATAVNTQAIAMLHEMGITIIGDFILSPDYDEAQFQALRDYLEVNPVDLLMPSILTPLPGTPLYESMKEKIVIDNLDYYTLTNAVMPTRLEEKVFYENYADLMKSGHARSKL